MFGCKPHFTGTRIIYLDKCETQTIGDVSGNWGPVWYRYALIANPPKAPDSLKQLIRHYCDSAFQPSAVEAQYYRCYLQFFSYSDNTKSYIKGKEDFWDIHNDILQEFDDYLGEYRFERFKDDSLHGQWTIDIKGMTDTLKPKY